MTPGDIMMEERLAAALRQLLRGRTVAEAVSLLEAVNNGMAACRAEQQAEASAEMITVH